MRRELGWLRSIGCATTVLECGLFRPGRPAVEVAGSRQTAVATPGDEDPGFGNGSYVPADTSRTLAKQLRVYLEVK
jgi:hypothetical protein